MAYYLGIDLGTTYTAAAIERDGLVEALTLGNRTASVPSVVFLRDDGEILVGEAATRRAMSEPGRVGREFKRRVGDPTPIILGGTPYAAEMLMARVLRWSLDRVQEQQGGAPRALALTHPANWGRYKLDLLGQAVRQVDVDVAMVLPEPVAAATFYASQRRLDPGAVVAVYDLGGGTFDAAMVRRRGSAEGFDLIGSPEGIERLGGIDFDEAVFAHVRGALGDALDRLDVDEPASLSAMSRLRQECIDAKEALSSDTDVSIPVLLPSLQTEVRLTRSEFEDMIRPAINETIVALRRSVRSAGVTNEDISAVLLVGGSSRIPLVAQMVAAELGRPIAIDAHPKDAISFGAAIAVAAQRGQATPETVTTVLPDQRPPPPTMATGTARPAPPTPGIVRPSPPIGTRPPAPAGMPSATTGTRPAPPRQPGVAQPGVAQPGAGQPGVGQPGVGQPGVGQPGVGQPSVGQPGAGQPGAGQAVQGQPGAGEPGVGQPGVGQPGHGQPGVGQPGVGQPGVGQPGHGQPGVGQPGVGQPGVGQPGHGQLGVGQPGVGQPGVGQPQRQPGVGQAGQGQPGVGQSSSGQQSPGQPGAPGARPAASTPGAAAAGTGTSPVDRPGQPYGTQPQPGRPGLPGQPGQGAQGTQTQPGQSAQGAYGAQAGQPGYGTPGQTGQGPYGAQARAGQPGYGTPGQGGYGVQGRGGQAVPPGNGQQVGYGQGYSSGGYQAPGSVSSGGYQAQGPASSGGGNSDRTTLLIAIGVVAVALFIILAALIARRNDNGAQSYTEEVRSDFVNACSAIASEQQCECMIDSFEDTVPFEDFKAYSDELIQDSSATPPEWHTSAVETCTSGDPSVSS